MIRSMMAAAALLAMAAPAVAQVGEPTPQPPIVTSSPAATTPAPDLSASASVRTADATDRQISAWIGDGGDGSGRSVPGVVSAMPAPRDRAIHGEVGASIGSGGYRSGYAIANMPIGEHSDVTVAIADQHLGSGNRSWGGYGGRGGDRQSLGIAVNLNGVGRGSPTAADCDRDAPPKWSLGLSDDAALSNRCRRLLQGAAAPPR